MMVILKVIGVWMALQLLFPVEAVAAETILVFGKSFSAAEITIFGLFLGSLALLATNVIRLGMLDPLVILASAEVTGRKFAQVWNEKAKLIFYVELISLLLIISAFVLALGSDLAALIATAFFLAICNLCTLLVAFFLRVQRDRLYVQFGQYCFKIKKSIITFWHGIFVSCQAILFGVWYQAVWS